MIDKAAAIWALQFPDQHPVEEDLMEIFFVTESPGDLIPGRTADSYPFGSRHNPLGTSIWVQILPDLIRLSAREVGAGSLRAVPRDVVGHKEFPNPALDRVLGSVIMSVMELLAVLVNWASEADPCFGRSFSLDQPEF